MTGLIPEPRHPAEDHQWAFGDIPEELLVCYRGHLLADRRRGLSAPCDLLDFAYLTDELNRRAVGQVLA